MAKNIECIEERKDSYRVHIPYYDESGARKFYSKSFSIRKYGDKKKALEMAKKHRDEIRVKIANDSIVKEKNYSLDDVYKKYYETKQESCETKRKYDWIYRDYIITNVDKNKKFKDIRFNEIQKTLNSMIQDVANDSISRCFTLWKRLYKFAISSDIVMKDETYKVDVPKSEKVIVKKDMTTTYEDIQENIDKIALTTKNKRNAYLYTKATLIMAYTGMRPAEVFALEKSSIDFENNLIHIRQKVGSTSTERFTITKPKTEGSYRDIDIPSELILPLHDLIDNSEHELLFMKDNGKIMNGNEFSSKNHSVSKGKFRAYTMRHQFITDGLQSGTDMRTIQEYVGHQNPSMTLSYARSNQDLQHKALQNRRFNRKSPKNEDSVPKTVPKID